MQLVEIWTHFASCDGCHVGKSEMSQVWVPVIGANDLAVAWTVQRMADLLRSDVADEVKMEEAQLVADSMAAKMIVQDEKAAARAKLPRSQRSLPASGCTMLHSRPSPRALSKIKQDRLASREHLRAVMHSLELLEIRFALPERPLAAADPKNGLRRFVHLGKAYLAKEGSASSQWVCFDDASSVTRIVLHPDEGGPLYAGFQFLAQKGAPIVFRRDEL